MRTFVDPAADFIPACGRVFGPGFRMLDGSRAVQIDNVKLQLERGERELWVIAMHGALEQRLAMVEVRGDIEYALLRAKEVLGGLRED